MSQTQKDFLSDHDVQSLAARFVEWGHKPSHAARVLTRYYEAAGEPEFRTEEIGIALRNRILADLTFRQSSILHAHRSADGTTKFLSGFHQGGASESVLMPAYRNDRAAGCVSSQIGCAMGCDFCASTRNGLQRNLTAGEIVEQFLHLKAAAMKDCRRLTSLVLMGQGEPMHNLDNVIPAIRRICEPTLGGLGWRQLTVSTVGIVPGIDRLADEDLNVNLAVSLHAPDDETRTRIVPTNRRYRIAQIMDAARRFHDKTGRIVTIEYCLLAGVNDSDAQAVLLSDLLAGFRAHVNVIPYNATGPGISGITYTKPSRQRISDFITLLRNRGVVAHVRETRGDDVNAACGQLRETLVSLGPEAVLAER